MNKIFIILGLILVVVLGFAWKMNKDSQARHEALNEQIKQQEIAKLQDKMRSQEIESEKAAKTLTDGEIKELQNKYTMDYLEAKQVIESPKMSQQDKLFYADIGGRWSDAIRVAGSTSRIALAQPVKDLQELRRELKAKTTSTYCESKMKEELLSAYDYAIDGFIEFMQKDELSSTVSTSLSGQKLTNATTLLDYC